MKLINKVKVLIIILIAVTIIFAILGTFNLYSFKEGLSDVPKCGNTSDDDMGDYSALKSTLIPPICPTCPYYNFPNATGSKSSSTDSSSSPDSSSSSGWGGFNIGNKAVNEGDNHDNKTTTDNSIMNKITDNSEQNKTDTNNTNTDIYQKTSQSQNVNQDNSVNQDMSQTDSTSADSKFNNLLGNNSIMFGSFGGGGQNSQTANNNGSSSGSLAVSTPAAAGSTNPAPYAQGPDKQTLGMINDLKGSLTKLNQQKTDDKKECPACPACERCPEPAFECKKVPNYRSPSIDNYMPVPVLNDFSRF